METEQNKGIDFFESAPVSENSEKGGENNQELSPEELGAISEESEFLKNNLDGKRRELQKLDGELTPLFAQERELFDELPDNIRKDIAEINGKNYSGGADGELASLKEKRSYLEIKKGIDPKLFEDHNMNRYSEVINDTRQDNFFNLKKEIDELQKRFDNTETALAYKGKV